AMARNDRRALDPAPDHEWKPSRRLLGRKRIALHAEALGLPHSAADLAPAVAAAGQPQRPDLVPGNRLARLFFQAVEDGHRILHQPGQVALPAKLAHQARSVPGATMRKLRLFNEKHILRTVPGQVIG